jgi:hypothetical protein
MVTPPDTYPHIVERQGRGVGASLGGVAVAAAAAGAAYAAVSTVVKKLDDKEEKGKK